ncbi:hypothetical protein [Paenibacillus sp. GSMTC-2017]|uniref:hypothetical protein n=1 Tax=Paenibacillus sp. GSMTC-2017 TaxID=2794350 RepID=UPI001E3349A4|nr:hypothetical protein [Paenibacillus sp. GSMTC-2017]
MMISKLEAEKRARANWSQWRLLLSDMNISYSDLQMMDQNDLMEANAALDIYVQLQKQASRSKKK